MIPNFQINDFEGPLDLLLHLVKESKMDIYEININTIIEEYLNFINHMEELNIDIASEYLVMAAELVHLKSKMLINRHDEEDMDEEDSSIESPEDLRNKIIEYEKYKIITKDFKSLEEKRNEVFTKIPESLKEFVEEKNLSNNISLEDLLNAFNLFLDRKEAVKPLNTKITKKELSVEERTKSIRNMLVLKKKVNFLELFEEYTKEYVIVTFLSILEMSKNNEIILMQENRFSPILIEIKEVF